MTNAEEQDDFTAELHELREQARALGMFTNDRELLACPACGLMEMVTFAGGLFTCRPAAAKADTGLRFPEPDESGESRCPACGNGVIPIPDQE